MKYVCNRNGESSECQACDRAQPHDFTLACIQNFIFCGAIGNYVGCHEVSEETLRNAVNTDPQ